MKLAPISETLVADENHEWLASKHGLDSTSPISLDGTTLGAIYTNGIIKSGTILAKNTTTGRFEPYNSAGANGTNIALGLLAFTVDVRNGSGGYLNSPAALLRHGQVYEAKLPRTAAQTGGPHANAKTNLAGSVVFR